MFLNKRKFFLKMFFLVVFILATLIFDNGEKYYHPGSDLHVYQNIFLSFKDLGYQYYIGAYDSGFVFFFYFLSKFLTFDWYLVFHKVFFYTSLLYAVLRFSDYKVSYLSPFFLLIIYYDFFLAGYSDFILRQGLGFIVLFLFSFYEMKFRVSILAVLVASLFHLSFVILLFVCIFSRFVKSLKFILILAVVSGGVYYLNIASLFVNLFIDFDLRSLSATNENYTVGFKFSFFIASYWIYSLFLFSKYRVYVFSTPKLVKIWSFYTCGIVVSVGVFSSLPYHDRIFSMFWVVQFFILYNFITRLKAGKKLCF